jgi:MoxR-like ATPase
MFKLTMGYPDLESERMVIRGNALTLEVEDLEPVISTKEVMDMAAAASEVNVSTAIETYLLELTNATREDKACALGAGPRASIVLYKASKVMAASDGRDRVYPEDIKAILRPVLAHRLMLTPDAVLRGETVDDVIERATSRIKPPLGIKDAGPAAPADGGDAPRARTRRNRQPAGAR